MTLGVSPAAAARATEGSEEAKQQVRAPSVRPMGGCRSHHKILAPTTAASVDLGRDGPSTPDSVEIVGRSARGSGDARGADSRGDDLRAAVSAYEQSVVARRLDASASPAASPATPRGTPPLGAADAARRAEETLADDGTPVGLRSVITASCDAQENLSAVETPSRPESHGGGADPPRPILRPEFPTFETVEAAAASFAHASFGVPIPASSPHHGTPSPSLSRAWSAGETIDAASDETSTRRDAARLLTGRGALEDVAREVSRLLKAATALLRGGASGRFADGQALVDQALRLAPKNVEAVCASGACHFSAGKLDEAYMRFARAGAET